MGPNDYVAVFGIDLGLLMLAPYTNNKETIKQAVEAFTSRESKKYTAVAAEARRTLENLIKPLSDAVKIALADSVTDMDVLSPPAFEGAKGEGSAIDPYQLMIATINLSGLKVLRSFERYEREFQGWRSVGALLAIINGQRNVRAARKMMLLFSEGFGVAPAIQEQYKSVISAANRTGLTIYALDIAGLRVVNPSEQTRLEREAAAAGRIRNQNPELVQGGVSSLGRAEELARMNELTTLEELSGETGGYTIKNTNDMSEGLKRILEELGNHYVITYVPTNQYFDGKFRRIAVKLTRTGEYRLRSRRGYYALRTLDDSPVMPHELSLFERLNSSEPTSDFPLYAQAIHFRGTNTVRQVAVYLEFPLSVLRFDVDDKAKSFSSRFAVLAFVKNNANEIVRKLGQEFILRGPAAQLEEVRKRPQIYNRLILLAPGQYTIEAVARDFSTGKASVTRLPFEVPATEEGKLRISSVVLSRGVNPLTEEQKKESAHPLYLEGQAYFVPNVSQTFSQAKDKNLLVHFNAYTGKNSATKIEANLEFLLQSGKVVASAGGVLPPPDASGRIAYLTSFPLSNFLPGEYDLRVVISGAEQNSFSVAHFKVAP
jgi:VWFA-related protein